LNLPSKHLAERRPRWSPWLAGALVASVTFAAFANSFSGPLIFDDFASISDNPSIRQLWPLQVPLSPPQGAGVAGRPVLNFSYALNYAFGRSDVASYHAVNLLIHLMAALALFGLVRRTIALRTARQDVCADRRTTIFAAAAALLWAVHPIQTASVTYLSQRAESLAGLFYLVTLYTFVRGAEADTPRARGAWFLGAVCACFLGMATKETMATAPLLVFLYDRTFLAGTFRGAWRKRGWVHLSLVSTWLLLLGLVATSRPNLRGIGFTDGISSWTYAITEAQVVIRYLGLAVWPHPLVLDYNLSAVSDLMAAAPWLTLLALLLASSVWALRRQPVLGFLGCSFFLLLSPSSSVIPVFGQVMAENRLYLPLAAVVVLLALAGRAALGHRMGLLVAGLIVSVFSGLTWQRNAEYRSALGLWERTAAQRPDNPRARYQLANALVSSGRAAEAIDQYQAALRLNPGFPEAWDGLGLALAKAGRLPEAIEAYGRAVTLRTDYPDAEYNLGNAFAQSGRPWEAISHYRQALRLQPLFPEAEENLGSALLETGDAAGAAAHYRAALAQHPDDSDTHYDLALALRALGRTGEAAAEFSTAARLDSRRP
jgi:tetratricopeptide (TPR) repeat protein